MKRNQVLGLGLVLMMLISSGAFANTASALPGNSSDVGKTAVDKTQIKHREHHSMHHKVKKAEEQKKNRRQNYRNHKQ